VELNEVTQVLLDEVERLHPARVVLDSLSELRLLAQNPPRFRRQILALKQYFVGRDATALLVDDRVGVGTEDSQAHSIAHGVIELEQRAPEYGAERRRARVVKMRGVKFRGGWHDFVIARGGLQIFPRLIAADHQGKFDHAVVQSGIAELDQLLGGGVVRGTSLLLMGPAGSGKTSLAMQFLTAAIERGEHCAAFLFEESLQTMLLRADGLGMNLRAAVADGKLTTRQVDPAELPPGEFVDLVRREVEEKKVRVVVIDSLNGYLNSMPAERFLVLHMHELLTYLGQQGVLTILVMAQHGFMGRMESPLDVSYLSDSVLLLRYFEAMGAIRVALSVLKKRTGQHERTIREMIFTPRGIEVGAALTDFHGVLTGVPTYSGQDSPLLRNGALRNGKHGK
jgi:circadian clock protein KaiC